MHYLIFLFLTAMFMGAFERNFVLFVILIVFGAFALKLVSMLVPGQKGS